MDAQTIRSTFLEFFKERGHTIKPSDLLVPSQDPTLLFTTAGMVQFKPLYAGAPLSFSRAATVQKCMRAGGKGSDLENVGKTIRHHTFFEMLGNFSFGDYFKKEAIVWGWEFLTRIMKLDKDRLWVSIFLNDDEAFDIWKNDVGLSQDRIVRLGAEDNFWGPAGDSGACGPSSEIHYDLGEDYACGKQTCSVGCGCERYLEIWNLVFPQFFQETDGSRRPLERRGIDTGMGLERLAFVSQGVKNNYHTDLFKPLLDEIAAVTGIIYSDTTASPFHVIADHIRTLTFTFAENILPSNDGRGYVVRRILRRAVRFGRKMSVEKAFLYKLVPVVIRTMKGQYPELSKQREHVMNIVKTEEERFHETLSNGLEMLTDIVDTCKKKKINTISGDQIFRLYDTYGFPVDLTEEIALEEELHLDMEGFQEKMLEQKKTAKASWKGDNQVDKSVTYLSVKKDQGLTEFTGYQSVSEKALLVGIVKDGALVTGAQAGDRCELILDKTPFYAESGGQTGDTGKIVCSEFEFIVEETTRPVEGMISHYGHVNSGEVKTGDVVEATIDNSMRKDIKRHHTATHLLHNALRSIVGEHVRQAGSLVAPDRLRFDFSHYKGLSVEELDMLEKKVNTLIMENLPVTVSVASKKEAEKKGAIALFGEKYGDEVRIVDIGGESIELCGGTHVSATGEIGLCKITSEASVASGVRRIEAVCGERAYQLVLDQQEILHKTASLLKISNDDIVARVEKLLKEKKTLEKELSQAKMQSPALDLNSIIANPLKIKNVSVFIVNAGEEKIDALRDLADRIKSQVPTGISVLVSGNAGKVSLVVIVSKDLVEKGVQAKDIIKEIAILVDGSGGGRPDLAQAGGKSVEKIPEALEKTPGIIENILQKVL